MGQYSPNNSKTMFQRIKNLIKGFFGLFIGNLEKKNPEALLENEKENLRRQISEFNKGLAAHAGLVEKLMSKAKKLDRQENELRAKTAANLKAGNREAAGKLALQLKAVDKEHDDVREQMEEADARYKELVKQHHPDANGGAAGSNLFAGRSAD